MLEIEKRTPKREKARRLLRSMLAGGLEVPEAKVREAARSAGVDRATLRHARDELGVCTRRVGWQGPAMLRLPEESAPTPTPPPVLNAAEFVHGAAAVAFLAERRRRWGR
jgi:hypothetical protein